ncbi:MAG: three-Cys-motif partner protein TcmP [Candidatus Binatales bacterium]
MSILARDGLPARESGAWTRDKLTYLRKYAAAFMTAMAKKRREGKWDQLVYIDLLAGPGICVDGQNQFDGSPLIALGVEPPFDHLFLGDNDPRNVAALERRVSPEDRSRVTLLCGDCNFVVRDVVNRISTKTLGLAFVDPEGFEVNFETLRVLATRRVDVFYLFPSGIGIRRNLVQFAQQPHCRMDDFWNGRKWRELPLAKRASGKVTSHDERQLERDWVSSFRKEVATLGLKYHDESDPSIRNNQGTLMYHLLFFSHAQIAVDIWRRTKRIEAGGQRGLFKN